MITHERRRKEAGYAGLEKVIKTQRPYFNQNLHNLQKSLALDERISINFQ
jgi:hypothetical protein